MLEASFGCGEHCKHILLGIEIHYYIQFLLMFQSAAQCADKLFLVPREDKNVDISIELLGIEKTQHLGAICAALGGIDLLFRLVGKF